MVKNNGNRIKSKTYLEDEKIFPTVLPTDCCHQGDVDDDSLM